MRDIKKNYSISKCNLEKIQRLRAVFQANKGFSYLEMASRLLQIQDSGINTVPVSVCEHIKTTTKLQNIQPGEPSEV